MNSDLLAELRLSLDIQRAETERLQILREMAGMFTAPLSELIQDQIRQILLNQTSLRKEYVLQHGTQVADLYKTEEKRR